jgi:hypothetical protein
MTSFRLAQLSALLIATAQLRQALCRRAVGN